MRLILLLGVLGCLAMVNGLAYLSETKADGFYAVGCRKGENDEESRTSTRNCCQKLNYECNKIDDHFPVNMCIDKKKHFVERNKVLECCGGKSIYEGLFNDSIIKGKCDPPPPPKTTTLPPATHKVGDMDVDDEDLPETIYCDNKDKLAANSETILCCYKSGWPCKVEIGAPNNRHVCRVGDDQMLTKARFDDCCGKWGGTGVFRNLADDKLGDPCEKYSHVSVGGK